MKTLSEIEKQLWLKIIFFILLIFFFWLMMLLFPFKVKGQTLDTLDLKSYVISNKDVINDVAKHNLMIIIPRICTSKKECKKNIYDEYSDKSASDREATFMGDQGSLHLYFEYNIFSITYEFASGESDIVYIFKEYPNGEKEYTFLKDDDSLRISKRPMKEKEILLFKTYIVNFVEEAKSSRNTQHALILKE